MKFISVLFLHFDCKLPCLQRLTFRSKRALKQGSFKYKDAEIGKLLYKKYAAKKISANKNL